VVTPAVLDPVVEDGVVLAVVVLAVVVGVLLPQAVKASVRTSRAKRVKRNVFFMVILFLDTRVYSSTN